MHINGYNIYDNPFFSLKDAKVHVLIKGLVARRLCIIIKLQGIYVLFQWHRIEIDLLFSCRD